MSKGVRRDVFYIQATAEKIKSILSDSEILQIARECGFVTRLRNIHPAKLFWTLLEACGTGTAYSIEALRRSYHKKTGKLVASSSFYERLDHAAFPEFLYRMYWLIQQQLYVLNPNELPTVFRKFSDVLACDGSSWAIHDFLSDFYPGRFTKTSPAAIEMHTAYSLLKGQFEKVAIAPDSLSELQFMPNPNELELAGKLFLFDRGYVDYARLFRIVEAGGHFIVRGKKNGNPLLVQVNAGSHRPRQRVVGIKLNDLRLRQGKDYDFSAIVQDKTKQKHAMRVLLIWNPRKREHTLFFTDLSANKVSLVEIGSLYRLRWQVELSYKELKSYTGLKKSQTRKPGIAEGLIWMPLIAMQLRRFIVRSAEQSEPKCHLSLTKAAINAAEFIPEFVRCALHQFVNLESVLQETFNFLIQTMKKTVSKKLNSFQVCEMVYTTGISGYS